MILRSITLENIRSYRNPTTIDFQLGTTLFEGDVASGKSTILSAVEFALFGLGDLNGSFLLRNGAGAGAVTLEFEVDGRDYHVHRSLVRKGENVRSGDSYIEEGGEREKYATKELKEKILQLLKFNEPSNPKAQSVIYRYAIFTPQEAMRDIIERDSSARLETLRKAYGIEQYRTAAQNAKAVSMEFRVRVVDLKARTSDLDEDRGELTEISLKIEELGVRLHEWKKGEERLGRELEVAKAAREQLENRREEIGKAQDRIPLLSRHLREKDEQLRATIRENESSEQKISQLTKDASRLEAVERPTGKGKEELDGESERLKKDISECRDKASKLSERLSNFNELLEKGVCPICEREYKQDSVDERRTHIVREIAAIDVELTGLQRRNNSVEDTLGKLREYQQAQRDLKPLLEHIRDLKERVAKGSTTTARLEAEIVDLNEQIRQATKATEPIQKIAREIEKTDDDIRRAEEDHSRALITIGGLEKEVESSTAEAEKLRVTIREKEGLLRMQNSLEEDRMWLSDYFAPTIELIERETFAHMNQRFNQQFQRWFQILVDDPDLRVRVKEDFSPVIEREGYEQDYRQLSGGERTSVALAYRLALNITVQEAALGQEPNLLILDEPTDGFSKEQLGKFGDILTELRCPQVILVSHERELENLADRVYRIDKVNGESMVTVAQLYQK